MRLDILTTGLQAIAAQAAAPGSKITFTRWELGDKVDFTFLPSITAAQGTVFASGDISRMFYVPLSSEEAMVVCKVSATDPTGVIGNLVLFVSFGGNEYPFAMLRQHVTVTDVKLQTSVHKVGTDVSLCAMLAIPGLLNRFDFSTLQVERPTWLAVDTMFDLPLPFDDLHDLFVVANAGDGRPALVFNVDNQLFGNHLMRQVADGTALNDQKMLKISGGYSGDGYVG